MRFLLVVLLFATACDESSFSASASVLHRAAGIEARVVVPETVDLLLDATEHSPGNLDTLALQLDAILPVLADRSGVVRLFVVRESVDATVVVSSFSFAASRSSNLHVQARERAAMIAAAREQLLRAAHASSTPIPRRSPLFAALTRIGMTSTPYPTRTIVLLSDLRTEEASGAARIAWECGPIDVETLVPVLDRERLLLPDSLRGVRVVAAFFDISPASKCQNTVARHLALREAWQQLIARAGARITFTSGPYGGER
ncbi:MAG TPA: hypothetical protein VF824_10725 [Thermoanaerobaculia bacterium]|jgi:hypothetical protein